MSTATSQYAACVSGQKCTASHKYHPTFIYFYWCFANYGVFDLAIELVAPPPPFFPSIPFAFKTPRIIPTIIQIPITTPTTIKMIVRSIPLLVCLIAYQTHKKA